MKALELKIPPPLVALTLGGLMWLSREVGVVMPLDESLKTLLTATLVGLGGTIDLLAAWSFLRAKTTVDPMSPNKASSLVAVGIYQYSRNPMYVGNFLFLLAWLIWLTALINVLFLFVYVAYITQFQIKPEERILGLKFGKEYDVFCREVRRWV